MYGRHDEVYATRSLLRRIARRIRDLYVTQMAVFLVLVLALIAGLVGDGRWHLELVTDHPWKGLGFGSFLLYEPGYLGILPMYCFFLFLTPLVLWQLRKGNWGYVIAVSGAVWIVAGSLIGTPQNPEGVDFGAFNPLSYQFLFVLGLAFGTGRLSIWRLSPRSRSWLISACIAMSVTGIGLRAAYAFDGSVAARVDRHAAWFSAVALGPVRLLSFAAFAVLVYWGARRVEWHAVESVPAFRWLSLIGRHSLPVFAWSILVTYAFDDFFPQNADTPLRALGVVVAVASLTIPAEVRARIRRRGKASYAPSPPASEPLIRSLRRAVS